MFQFLKGAALSLGLILTMTACDDGNGGDPILVECPPLDLVFVMDTSSSMTEEGTALCGALDDVETRLEARGAVLEVSTFSITEDLEESQADYPCLTQDVRDVFGDEVPGSDATLSDDLPDDNDNEDWGNATAILADEFPWTTGALRVVIPISDEGPDNGDGCDDPGDDRDAITNAINVCQDNDVIASPIAAAGASDCVIELGEDLADATGGIHSEADEDATDLADAIFALVEAACTEREIDER